MAAGLYIIYSSGIVNGLDELLLQFSSSDETKVSFFCFLYYFRIDNLAFFVWTYITWNSNYRKLYKKQQFLCNCAALE